MLELRENEGPDAVAKRCLADIKKGKTPAVVEGVRNPEELDYFKGSADIVLIAVHASPATRFNRLMKRGRPDDPKDLATFRERDLRELKVGLGSVIAQADKMFLNEGTLEELTEEVKKYFEGVKSGNKGIGRG
jgi:dephospho-CoA kinase